MMQLFDFHHHDRSKTHGIYNLTFPEDPPAHYFSAGIHPAQAAAAGAEMWTWLENQAAMENCAAIGECGLDTRVRADENLQRDILLRQIELANALQKPLILHCVRRFPELITICKNTEVPLILHGFNKNSATGEALLKAGFFLSFGASLLKNVNLQRFFAQVPVEKIFLETDASGGSIEEVYALAAGLKKIDLVIFNDHIKQNLKNLKITDR